MSLLQQKVLQSWEQSCHWKQNLTMKCLDDNGNPKTIDLSDYIYSSTGYFKNKQKVYFGIMAPTDLPHNDPFHDTLETWNTLYRLLYEACNGTKIMLYLFVIGAPFGSQWDMIKRKVTSLPLERVTTHITATCMILHGKCFSFAQPHCIESYEECVISQDLLIKYIRSDHVVERLGLEATVLEQAVVGYVFPHMTNFAHYRYSHLRHYGVHSNNAVEGTHSGYKNSGISVAPSDSMCTMADKLHNQSELKLVSGQHRASTQKTWTNSKTSNHVITCAEYELVKVHTRINEYQCLRVGRCTWRVVSTSARSSITSVIPRFDRVRQVVMHQDGTLLCTCRLKKKTEEQQ